MSEFLHLALFQDDEWACELVSRIIGIVDVEVPHTWELEIGPEHAGAVADALAAGKTIKIAHLLAHPRDRESRLACIPLLLHRKGSRDLLPAEDKELHPGDRILFCGRHSAQPRMEWTLLNEHTLVYVLTGGSISKGWIWRQFDKGREPRRGRSGLRTED